jgi:arylsulfatase A-like enzyme
VVAIADVDRASHRSGAGTAVASAAVRRADRLVGELCDVLVARGLWERAVVIVTADHGFETILPDGVVELPADTASGIAWVDEGRVALGRPVDADAPAGVPAAILAQPGVAGVRTDLARIGLAHPRAGSMLLLAAAGHAFTLDRAGYRLRGDHGGEEERAVPFIVVGGDPGLRRLRPDVRPELPDVAPTLAAILGVRDPRSRRSGALRHGRRLPIWAPR